MSLTGSIETARSHLSATAEYIQVVSRNIARADDPSATRKITGYISNTGGTVRLGDISRAQNALLYSKALASSSNEARDKAIVNALDQLNAVVGDPQDQSSPAAWIAKFEASLQSYSEAPQDYNRATAALAAAQDLANGLRAATRSTQDARKAADGEIANSVDQANSILTDLEKLNQDIVRDTLGGRDVTDKLDTRDQLISQLSEKFGVVVQYRENNDIVVRTDSGVTLLDRTAFKLSFQAAGAVDANTMGNAILVDGVPITGPNSIQPITSGSLAGLVKFRDVIAPQYQAQLDEVARGLVEAFAEQKQTAGAGPDQTGLFSYSGSPAVPASGVRVVGLAGTIAINSAVVADPTLIRDGGINGANYDYNPTSAAGFTDRILGLAQTLTDNRNFASDAGLDTQTSVTSLAALSDGWLSAQRQSASSDYDYSSVSFERASDALSKDTGINVDEEYLRLLELQRAYQASTKLIATVDKMFDSLLQAAG